MLSDHGQAQVREQANARAGIIKVVPHPLEVEAAYNSINDAAKADPAMRGVLTYSMRLALAKAAVKGFHRRTGRDGCRPVDHRGDL